MSTITVHTDGGARGNPGPAGIGVVIHRGSELVGEWGRTIGSTTNNQAEYQAVDWAVELLAEVVQPGEKILFLLDSQLIERQIIGAYKVKDPGLSVWRQKIVAALEASGWSYEFQHVPRAENKEADRLVNAALDGLL